MFEWSYLKKQIYEKGNKIKKNIYKGTVGPVMTYALDIRQGSKLDESTKENSWHDENM